MIQWVYEKAREARCLENLVIATDDSRIFDAGRSFGADVRMSSTDHRSGTERAAEIAAEIDCPIFINIQGDEPLLHGSMVDDLVEALQESGIPMATLAVANKDLSRHADRNLVKVVKDCHHFALYFSRAPIPHGTTDFFWQHIGIYGYQKDFLSRFSSLPVTPLETSEKLEQMRALENGFRIKIVETVFSTLSVDTPEDIIKVENIMKADNHD
jgi:3-deoxy-manno-octulosonate cytidylyltransferase (CMP-KDO synthetase)